LVIEAVPEVLELKQEVFRSLDALCPPETILATNTSTMSPTAIGSVTGRPDRVIGMHFFNPAHLMKLVEVVRSLDTSDETCATAVEVARRMGKETVVVNESPGFITSRISALVGNEAFYMLQEGVASAADIDRAVKLGLNYPMGPLELADLVGLDVRLRNLEYLHQMLGEKFRPCPLLVKYVQAGRLGKKTGRGVYDYPAPGAQAQK
jgi:3-hydroxybutyryl-CoA dehydrogenase